MIRALFIAVILFIIGLPMESFSARSQIKHQSRQLGRIKCTVLPYPSKFSYVDCTNYRKNGNKNYGGQRGFIPDSIKFRSVDLEIALYDKNGKIKDHKSIEHFEQGMGGFLQIIELKDIVDDTINNKWLLSKKDEYFLNSYKGDELRVVYFTLDKNMEIFDRNGKKMKGTLSTPSPNLDKDATECFYEEGFETLLIQNADNSDDRCHNAPVCSAQVRCIKNKKWIDQHIACLSYKKSGKFVCPTADECINSSKKIKQTVVKKSKNDNICNYDNGKIIKFKDACDRIICLGKVHCLYNQLKSSFDFYVACRNSKYGDGISEYKCPLLYECINDDTLVVKKIYSDQVPIEDSHQSKRKEDPNQMVDGDATQ